MENNLITQINSELFNSVSNSLQDTNTSESDAEYSFYTYNGVPVPRVTLILKKVIAKPGLLYWAASIGKKNLYIEQKSSTKVGSAVHKKIEMFLKTGVEFNLDYDGFYYSEVKSVDLAYQNFLDWYKYLRSKGYSFTPIATEVKLVCPYYGGTIDCIAEINGAKYIIDWKTSKQILPEYYIQTAAYMWAINNGYCPEVDHVDGIGVVRIDKSDRKFEDSFLTYHIHKDIIDGYISAFGSLLHAYYNLSYVEQFNNHYKLEENIEGLLENHD